MSAIAKTATVADLPPVVTRQDCHSWLSEEDVQTEVWAAYRGAVRHTDQCDFADLLGDMGQQTPLPPGSVLADDGTACWDRGAFLDYLAAGIVWRLRALAERRGVDLSRFDPVGTIDCPLYREQGFSAPYFAPLGGEVQAFHFDSEREMRAFMKAQGMSHKKKAPAGAANTPEAMTNFGKDKADGTDCRT